MTEAVVTTDMSPQEAYAAMKGATKVTIRDPSSHEKPVTKWRHLKTGGYYRILHFALFEGSLKAMVAYQSYEGSGPVWIRPSEQFFDGRYVIDEVK